MLVARARSRGILAAVFAVLGCALILLLTPGSAGAVTYTVNSIGDQPDENPGAEGCKTTVANCTLRAAIQESNFSTSVDDVIQFSALFNGETLGTISIGGGFPVITDSVVIAGDASGPASGRCATSAGVEGPCVGVSGEPGLDVQASGTTISGLAVFNATIGIAVEADGVALRDNWIGIKLDGTAGTTAPNVGIFVAPGADNAQVGGVLTADRNVIGNTTSGLVLRGASLAQVQGNYFGVRPDGTTVAPNSRDLVVANKIGAPDVPATDNLIGANVGAGGAETPACDFGCNVFASSASSDAAIDLLGQTILEEKSATGPTTILGNYLGLDAAGQPFASAATSAIRVGSAGDVTIGGLQPGEANQIHGGGYGVFAGNLGVPAKELQVLGNMIGRALDNSDFLFPPGEGISLSSAGIAVTPDASIVEGNYISATGNGIENHSAGATIAANHIYGGTRGIWTKGSTEESGIGNLIKGNTITDALEYGVFLQNDFNVVIDNYVSGSEVGIGIGNFLTLDSTGNLIGGDGDGEDNLIFESASDAIEVVDVEGSQNEIGRNGGSGNGGLFIDLRAAEPGTEPNGPNGGIKPPVVTTASKTGASGTAEAGATVRVFAKAGSEPGELGDYLGKASAGIGGEWSLVFLNPVAVGSLVAATQTNTEGGTSEVSATATVPPDQQTGCEVVVPKPPSCLPPPPPDTTRPNVTIEKAPKAKSTSTTAKFKFVSNEAGSKFKCKLDKKAFANCRSPKTYKKLKLGKHVFKVKATDAAGNVSAVVTKKFTVLPPS
ncbi:MAG TPA: NosD domain-containing protein [Solirubrobacterales bacterium]|nr:NosD domain-containing protein [Solirubrobacterales bacterium]